MHKLQQNSLKAHTISLLLDDEEEEDENDYLKQKRTIWVKPWLQRRGEQGIYNNLFQELLLEDKKSFKDYIGSKNSGFCL